MLLMQVTLRANTFQPISLIELHQVKRAFKPNPFFTKMGNFVRYSFKNTAFYDFFLIASSDPD